MLSDLLNALTGVEVCATTTYFNRYYRPSRFGNVDFRVASSEKDLVNSVRAADVVVSHLTATAKAHQIAKACKKPFIQLIHNDYRRTEEEIRLADLRVYNTRWLQRRFSKFPGIVVHPPALHSFETSGDEDGAVTLINLCDNKGPDVFYALANRLPHRAFLGVHGGYLLNRQRVRTDIANVTIHPFVDDVRKIYSKTSILIVPSIYESYGRVAVEAMSCGIPVVASNTAGLKESVGAGGVLLPREPLDPWMFALGAIWDDYDTFSMRAYTQFGDLADETEEELKIWQAAVTSLC